MLLLLSHFSSVWFWSNPREGSPPGSTIPGILQARTLEWVAISFSSAWKWKVKVKSFSHVWLFSTPWTAAHQAPPSTGFSGQEYWRGLHCLLQALLHDPAIPLLCIYPPKWKVQTNMYKEMLIVTLFITAKSTERTQMYSNRWMDKQIVVYIIQLHNSI